MGNFFKLFSLKTLKQRSWSNCRTFRGGFFQIWIMIHRSWHWWYFKDVWYRDETYFIW